MIGSIALVVWMYSAMLVLGIVYLPALLISRRWVNHGIRTWVRAVRFGLRVFVGITTEFRGAQNLPQGAFLYAAKHQSMYDAVAPFLFLEEPAIIHKRELLYYPIFGWYAARGEMIPIDRGGASKALKSMVRAALKRTADGRPVVIFPEGTRQAPGAPPDYKVGVYALYRQLDVPCVPVATNTGLCWPAHGLRRYRGHIVFEALPPIPPGLDRRQFMTTLQDQIEPATERLLSEGQSARSAPARKVTA